MSIERTYDHLSTVAEKDAKALSELAEFLGEVGMAIVNAILSDNGDDTTGEACEILIDLLDLFGASGYVAQAAARKYCLNSFKALAAKNNVPLNAENLPSILA